MAKKPVILVTTNELYKTAEYENHYYDGLSSELGIPLLFIDAPEELDLRRSMSVDEARYQRYLETYVKTPHSISKLLWEIVDDEITNKYQKTKIYNRA